MDVMYNVTSYLPVRAGARVIYGSSKEPHPALYIQSTVARHGQVHANSSYTRTSLAYGRVLAHVASYVRVQLESFSLQKRCVITFRLPQ